MHLPTVVRFREVVESADAHGNHFPTYSDQDLLQLHAPDTGDSQADMEELVAVSQAIADRLAMRGHCRVAVWFEGDEFPTYFANGWQPRVDLTIPGYFKNDDSLCAHLRQTAVLMAKAARL